VLRAFHLDGFVTLVVGSSLGVGFGHLVDRSDETIRNEAWRLERLLRFDLFQAKLVALLH
jgi:hypothetical protein